MTLTGAEISVAALKAAGTRFARGDVDDVLIEDAVASDGADAVRITIVVKSGAFDRIADDAVLETLVDIRKSLADSGDGRLPIVYYTTPDELAESGDT